MKLKLAGLSFWKLVAALSFALGLYAAVLRFAGGLGVSTNLTDQFPWGLWIGFDVLVGVGLAAGGFVIATTVHIFNIEKYEPISRPAILTAFLGYLLVVIAIMFDLGRPYRIWHPLIMWNPRSVMFEVGWCVTLYTIVLALEFSPVVSDRFNLKAPLKLIRALYLPAVIAGVLLSILHQSSLGTLYVIVPDKLHGLWYSSLLPVFFFITAIAAGLAMTIIESFLSFRAFGRRLEKDLLMGLGRVIVVVLAVYCVFKMQDLHRHNNLELLFQVSRETVLFWGEMGLGVVLPMVLLFSERIRQKEVGLLFSAIMVVIGFIVSRLNVSITGMLHSETYFPKWTEIAVSVSLVVLGFTIFAQAVKHLNVFPKDEPPPGREQPHPVFTGNLVLGMWAIVLLGALIYGMTKSYTGEDGSEGVRTAAPISRLANPFEEALSLPADFAYPVGEDSPGPVTFSHRSHVAAQKVPSCAGCHVLSFNILRDGQLDQNAVRMDDMYEGRSCGICHSGEKAFSTEECQQCHVE